LNTPARAAAIAHSGSFAEIRRCGRKDAHGSLLPERNPEGRMAQTPLFRPAAVAAQRASAYGRITLVRPLSAAVLTAAACSAAAAIIAVLVWGTYTKHTTLRGELVPSRGVIEVQAPQHGTIIDRRVREGERVHRAATLFVLSSERLSAERGATHAAVSAHLGARQRSIEAQIRQTRLLERAELAAMAERVRMLQVERVNVEAAAAEQLQRVAYAEEAADRYGAVNAQGFVSDEQLLMRREGALDQRVRAQSLDRELTRVERELAEAASAAAVVPLSFANQIAELERAVDDVQLQIAENEARRNALAVAPQSGVATAVTAQIGETVEAGETLAIILPEDGRLYAQLLAPSAAVGFLRAGDEVRLRYDAYPYQKFGHYRGTIRSISGAPRSAGQSSSAFYVVVVELAEQTVHAYGTARSLRAGMSVEADVLQETRRLYEWILEPLLTLRREFH
jgi:membrane fusion protein